MLVALTGGIGSGKTTVGKMFEELGVPVYNSDIEAKRLMFSSKKLKNKIIVLFGNDAYQGNMLNKSYIAEKVFSNRTLLQNLNAIVHPAVREHFLLWAKKQDFPYVIQEAAVVFENGSHTFYDKIILVTAPVELRVERILSRDSSSENQVRSRMDNQWDDKKKIPFSDFVIVNENLEKTKSEVETIHQRLLEYS